MKTVKINLFEFNELSQPARERAINDHLIFLDNEPEQYEDEDGEMKSEYIEHSDQDAIDSIEANEYLFFDDGILAHIINFCGKHPKAGKTELKFHGAVIEVK